MKQVFQKNDVVYHNVYGQGRVIRSTSDASCLVYFSALGYDANYSVEGLSFTPWPPANHERPLKDGLYRRSSEACYDQIVIRKDGKFYYGLDGKASVQVADCVIMISKLTYLGD